MAKSNYLTKVEKYSKRYLENEILEIKNSGRKTEIPELNIFEKAVVFKYSHDGFESPNEKLKESRGKENTEFGKILNLVLSKLPDYDGVVYRGAKLTSGELGLYSKAFRQKKPIIEHTFVSTSKSRLIGMEFRGNVLFRIYSRTGKEIEKIAKFGIFNPPNEREVLFRPNRSFRVLEITNENDYTLITMEEL